MGKTDAAMTLFKSQRFDQIANFSADFAFSLGKNYDAKDDLAAEMYYPAVALFTVIKDKLGGPKLTLVVNTHILYNIKKGHVKLAMVVLIFKTILRLKSDYPIGDVFFCGDFNMIANSMLYSYIAQGDIDLDADLNAYSNQAMAISMHGKKEIREEIRIQDFKYRPAPSQHKPVRIDPRFVSQLANCDVDFVDGSRVVFKSGKGKQMTIEEAEDYFRHLSDTLYFRSAYASVNRQLAKRQGIDNKDRNYEEGVSFFVSTMHSTVDYIWCSSDDLTVNSVLQKPSVEVLQALPKTAPVADYPSDHFCLYAEYRKLDDAPKSQ